MTPFTLSSHEIAAPPPVPVRTPAPPRPPARGSWARGRYDAAQTTDQNRAHWSNADALSANAAASPTVRRTLRNRARYETANNGYAHAAVRTKRNDVVGTGPRLQLTLPATWTDPDFGTAMTTPADAAQAVERKFRKWMRAARVPREMRVMEESAERDGEVFGVFGTNPQIDDAVKLCLRSVEADQCATPDRAVNDLYAVDGIRFDRWGNPAEYHFLKVHPGSLVQGANPWEYDRVSAAYVVHWFDPDRPGQRRGVSHLAPGLNLYGQTRRFTGATLAAAETAANHAAVLYTDQPAPGADDPAGEGDRGDDSPEAFDRIPMPQNGGITLPNQWRVEQLKPEQPTTTYPQFKGELLAEAGAALNLPRNISTKSSAEYNYSSARLDSLPYRQDVRILRDDWRDELLDRMFKLWLREARAVPGHLPAGLPPVEEWEWSWGWDGWASIDPLKDATADDVRLKNGSATLAGVLSEQGKDVEEHLRQRAKEIALARKLEAEYGLPAGSLYPLPSAPGAAPPPPPAGEAPLTALLTEDADAAAATAA